uniref:ORF61 n=1 Tax=Latid herpesvirus 1 TaxID=3096545 RepID=A0AB33V6M3_9VIRU
MTTLFKVESALTVAKSFETENILPEKIYFRGCVHKASPMIRDEEPFNEILLLQDELCAFGACLGYFIRVARETGTFLFSPWLTETGVVIIRDPLMEYAMRIYRAITITLTDPGRGYPLCYLKNHINNMSQFSISLPSIYYRGPRPEAGLFEGTLHQLFMFVDGLEELPGEDGLKARHADTYGKERVKLEDLVNDFPLFFNYKPPNPTFPHTFKDPDRVFLFQQPSGLFEPRPAARVDRVWGGVWPEVAELYSASVHHVLEVTRPEDAEALGDFICCKTGFRGSRASTAVSLLPPDEDLLDAVRFARLVERTRGVSLLCCALSFFF